MSRPGTPAGSLPSRFPASTVVDTTSVSAEVMRNRSTSASSKDGKAKDLLDSSMGEKDLASNPKTRKDWAKFTQLVDRTLQSFESVSEWADFITFLSKLLKCLQAYPNFAYIPHRLVVAKRLAQCLNPALPTGVHQRALDVYVHILNAIGPENLRRDLQLWSSGLFPFFQYSATSVRPIVLGIYSKFYIPLQDALRPATKAMILALLPGLEEETGEFFDKVASLLDQLSGTVSPSFFLQNIWLVLITAPSLRIAALNYLSRRMPKISPEDSISPIVGDDVGLMVRGFASTLEDSQVLVQRAALDLVLSTLQTDGAGFQKDTRHEEQALLVRAMTSVVLRRDLSLSRRLYSWLLGPSEDSEQQIAHLRQNALMLLHESLITEIKLTEAENVDTTAKQRPYKVIISLLDKWEIAYPLTEVMVLDLFRALNRALSQDLLHDDLIITTNTLFDSLDPFLTWRQLFFAAQRQMQEERGEGDALQLIDFMLNTFRLDEDEITRLHAPLFAFAILDMMHTSVSSDIKNKAIAVVHSLLKETSPSFFAFEEVDYDAEVARYSGLKTAVTFYEAKDNKTAKEPATGFAYQITSNGLSTVLNSIVASIRDTPAELGLIANQVAVLTNLVELIPQDLPLKLQWEPDEWLRNVLECLTIVDKSHAGFELLEATTSCLLSLYASPIIPPIQLDKRKTVSNLTRILLSFLQPSTSIFHVQTVSLIWNLQAVSRYRHVEAALCGMLLSPDETERQAAYEAFGNLWRLTEDNQLPGVRLAVAMHIMLDALRSDDLGTRRAGEAWMRCSVKSYLRILDPLLYSIMGPHLLVKSTTIRIADTDLQIDAYQHVFEFASIRHTLENLLSLVSFGGQGLTRVGKTSYVKQSHYQALKERAAACQLESDTYLDTLCKTLARLLRSEAINALAPAVNPYNIQIHAATADLLQLVISRGDLDLPVLQSIESALVTRLFLSVHRNELDLQNKLLHVLHSTITAVANLQRKADRRSSISHAASTSISSEKGILSISGHDPLLVKVLCDGISKQQSSAAIHHWVDFLLMTVQHLRGSLNTLVFPLIDCIATRLTLLIAALQKAYQPDSKGKEVASHVSDADYTILLNAMERLFSVALEDAKVASALGEEPTTVERTLSPAEAGGFLGYITTALGTADGGSVASESAEKPKSPLQIKLDSFINLLLSAWDVASSLDAECDSNEAVSEGYVFTHIKTRTRKAFERVYKTNSADVVQGIINTWYANVASGPSDLNDKQDRLFGILGRLSADAQSVVTMVCDLITQHSPMDRIKSGAPSAPSDYEMIHFAFLEAYMARIDGAVAVQIWVPFYNFVKDVTVNPPAHKYRLLPALRCVTTLAEKMSQTSALEDRRLRRDLHDTFIKLTDATVQMSGRSGEGLRRPHSDTRPSTPMEVNGSDKLEAALLSEKVASNIRNMDSGKELTTFLAQKLVPDFRRFSIDNDKLAATCANIMYYTIAPAFKTRSKSFDVDDSVLELLSELTKVPAGLKAWRTQVLETFSDNRFFYGPPSTSRKWRSIVQALVASDKERFSELISKISASTSANIFVNRELESLSKSMNIRRLSYTIFCGEKNRYLVQLPAIQEKVVELLRAQVSDLVHSEVYLCLRVLLCRIGDQHLSSFWPIILTELLRLFESLINEPAAPTGEYLQLILSACKFLDLLLVLQTEDFQIHQWMFITDTVDAVYPPENWTPQAIMDRLGVIIGARQDLLDSAKTLDATPRLSISIPGAQGSSGQHRPTLSRPLLGPLRQSKITSLASLEPFFSRASLANYEAVYSLGGIDWSAVEESVEVDLFEG